MQKNSADTERFLESIVGVYHAHVHYTTGRKKFSFRPQNRQKLPGLTDCSTFNPHRWKSGGMSFADLARTTVLHAKIDFGECGGVENAEDQFMTVLFTSKLPTPTIRRTEFGYQLFWILSHPLNPSDWRKVMSKLRKYLRSIGVTIAPKSMSYRAAFELCGTLLTPIRTYTIRDFKEINGLYGN